MKDIEPQYYLTEESREFFFWYNSNTNLHTHTQKTVNWKNISFPLYVITLLFIQISHTILFRFFFF